MAQVTKRELNQRTADVLAAVSDDADVVITERGVPRWRVSTVRPADTTLSRLEREGRYTPPAARPTAWPCRGAGPPRTDAQVDALLDETRGDR